jgi:YHS domain-containing protein
MTPARQTGKIRLALIGWALAGLVLGCVLAPQVATAAEPAVVDANTGIAISGFDPVSYFTGGGPKAGHPDFELSRDGTVWRFSNEGNRAAFAGHPEVYTPRFGGYDAVAIARGASVPGHPLYWVMAGERVYLFYSEQARAEFIADPGSVIERAARRWPDVMRTIAR